MTIDPSTFLFLSSIFSLKKTFSAVWCVNLDLLISWISRLILEFQNWGKPHRANILYVLRLEFAHWMKPWLYLLFSWLVIWCLCRCADECVWWASEAAGWEPTEVLRDWGNPGKERRCHETSRSRGMFSSELFS